MAYPGALDLQALAKLNDIDPAGEDAASFRSRAIDADGDGRPDLYLVDHDGDGSVDGVVRAVDSDGDGVNDTFVQYGEDGKVESIGRVDPATGELDVIYEEPDAIDKLLGSLGLVDLESPEEALFTSFEDPYIFETYGSYGEDVPEVFAEPEPLDAQDLRVTEMSEEDAAALEAGAPAEEGDAEGVEGAGPEAPPEVVPKIVEIEDRSGGAGSSLWAKVDQDGDGLADTDAQLGKTSTGTYYGDINKDGYSENVATDLDMDGRIDTVDTTGRGSSSDTVGAERIVEPGSAHLVDGGPGDAEDDDASAAGGAGGGSGAGEAVESGIEYDAGGAGGSDAASDDGPATSGGSGDVGGSVLDDSGSDGGYDSGSSSSGDDTV